MLFYPAAPPLSRSTLTYTAGVIRRHRRPIVRGGYVAAGHEQGPTTMTVS
jgi:hypothetical protein